MKTKDQDTGRSRSGHVIFLGKGPVIWSSKLQDTVALSSAEAEYLALSAAAKDVLWARSLAGELGFVQHDATRVMQDNKSTIAMATLNKQHKGIKHINIRHHFIRDYIAHHQKITLLKIPTGEMVADLLTKALAYPAFARHRAGLGLM